LKTKIVSVGSLAAAVVFPTVLVVQKSLFNPDIPNTLVYFSLCLAALIFITHRTNIKRLLKGQENKFGSKKKQTEEK
jgi:glycerol-3-phosphate acyltransferase PlsY